MLRTANMFCMPRWQLLLLMLLSANAPNVCRRMQQVG
jgi:hypothetical protein